MEEQGIDPFHNIDVSNDRGGRRPTDESCRTMVAASSQPD
jgi:hypothetical protein